MRYKFLAICLFLCSFPVFAQEPLTFTATKPCALASVVLDSLMKLEEKPFLFMLEPIIIEKVNSSVVPVRGVLWLNTKTNMYTIVQVPPHLPDSYLCVSGSGKISHIERSVLLELLDNNREVNFEKE